MTDKDKPSDIKAQDSVQSYLDLLLSKPAENSHSATVEYQIDQEALRRADGDEIPGKKHKVVEEDDLVVKANQPLKYDTKEGVLSDNPESLMRGGAPVSSRVHAERLTQVQRFTPTLRRKRDYLDLQDEVEQRSFARPLRNPLLKLPLPEVQTSAETAPLLPYRDKPRAPDIPVLSPKVSDEAVLETPKEPSEGVLGLNKLYPPWAQRRFECLLFTVCGLTLAVPLTELGAIYPMTEELTPIFGQVDWFLGLLPVKDRNIRVINTTKVVMPERFDEETSEQFNYVISINGVDWGLAAEGVSSSISLDPESIKWRGKRSKRPWLAGTVVEHMCALLDVNQLTLMFVEKDK
ncbi:MAG: purine-binding chemotaxis protein CheW [Gammaproteobacteria bacterium]|jgi:purine-binding chemotaxis protein CheW